MFTGGVEDDVHRTVFINGKGAIGGAVVKNSLGHNSYILCLIEEVENYNQQKHEVNTVSNKDIVFDTHVA